MKKVILFLIFLSCLCSVVAQESQRDRILDTLAYGTVNRMRFSEAVDNALEITQMYTYRPVAEYAVFNFAYSRMAECFNSLTDDELHELLHYVTSKPYRRLMSVSFWNSFSMMLYDATDAEYGISPHIDMRSGGTEYRDKARQLIRCMKLAPIMSSYVNICRNKVLLASGRGSRYMTCFDKVCAEAESAMIQTMLDYFPVEDIDFLITFHETSLSDKVKSLCDGHIADFNYFLNLFLVDPYFQGQVKRFAAGSNVSDLYRRVYAIRDELAVDTYCVSKDDILDVTVRIRTIPYPFVSQYRGKMTLELGDFSYIGHVRDGKPHGEGTMMSEDGTRETGTYRYGQKNGFFTSCSADGVESVSVWADGHLVDPQSVGKLPDGSVPSVPLVGGMPFGYGACMKGHDTYFGQFVDGRLNGYGTMIRNDTTRYIYENVSTGHFINDVLVEGVRVEKHDNGERHYKGRFVSEGVTDVELALYNTSGVMTRCVIGTILSSYSCDGIGLPSSYLDGIGEKQIYVDSLTVVFKGNFIKDELYGDGTSSRVAILENGMLSELYTEGRFWDNEPYLIHKRVEKFTNIPVEAGKARVLHSCGVRVVTRGTNSLTVTCEGVFEEDFLKSGRVTMSDGTWMEGTFADGWQIDGTTKAVDKYGTVYEGEVHDGRYHGKGKCTYRDGSYFIGNFSDGSRRGGKYYSPEGKLLKVLSD